MPTGCFGLEEHQVHRSGLPVVVAAVWTRVLCTVGQMQLARTTVAELCSRLSLRSSSSPVDRLGLEEQVYDRLFGQCFHCYVVAAHEVEVRRPARDQENAARGLPLPDGGLLHDAVSLLLPLAAAEPMQDHDPPALLSLLWVR